MIIECIRSEDYDTIFQNLIISHVFRCSIQNCFFGSIWIKNSSESDLIGDQILKSFSDISSSSGSPSIHIPNGHLVSVEPDSSFLWRYFFSMNSPFSGCREAIHVANMIYRVPSNDDDDDDVDEHVWITQNRS